MVPITRETITVDRRHGGLRWSAVLAGAAVAIAIWVLLQMLGVGVGLTAIQIDDAGSLRSFGIGTTIWAMIAPLIGLFIGGLVAGRLAASYDQKVGAMHGFVVWAISSMLGMLATVSLIGALASSAMHLPTRGLAVSEDVTVDPSLRAAELQRATDNAGKILLGGGFSLLLGLGAAVGGGAIGAPNVPRRRRQHTDEVPVVPPPPEPPAEAPRVTSPP